MVLVLGLAPNPWGLGGFLFLKWALIRSYQVLWLALHFGPEAAAQFWCGLSDGQLSFDSRSAFLGLPRCGHRSGFM